MNKCEFALANVLTTALTAAIEYKTAITEEEGIKRIEKRIKENKTIESVVDCALQDDLDCKCK